LNFSLLLKKILNKQRRNFIKIYFNDKILLKNFFFCNKKGFPLEAY